MSDLSAYDESRMEEHMERLAEEAEDRAQYESDRAEAWLLEHEEPEEDPPCPGPRGGGFADPWAGLHASLARDDEL